MKRGYFHSIFTSVGLVLYGCSSPPPFDAPQDRGGRPTVRHILDKVECEIAEARDDVANNNKHFNEFLKRLKLKPFGEWKGSATLTLTVNDTTGLFPTSGGVSLSYVDPLKIAGTTFGFGGNLILNDVRARTFSEIYSIDISKIPHELTCENVKNRWAAGFDLQGDLGLREQIYMGLHSFDYKDDGEAVFDTGTGKTDTIGATVSFHVFKGVGNLGPTWTLVHLKGPVGGLGYQRDDLHQIVVTFAPQGLTPVAAPAPGTKPIAPPKPSAPVPPQKPVEPKRPKLPLAATKDQIETLNSAYINLRNTYNVDMEKYNKELVPAYEDEVRLYPSKVNQYVADVAKYTADLAEYSAKEVVYQQVAASGNAQQVARTANQNLVTEQAIRDLGAVFARP